jgi:hypothetical protein
LVKREEHVIYYRCTGSMLGRQRQVMRVPLVARLAGSGRIVGGVGECIADGWTGRVATLGPIFRGLRGRSARRRIRSVYAALLRHCHAGEGATLVPVGLWIQIHQLSVQESTLDPDFETRMNSGEKDRIWQLPTSNAQRLNTGVAIVARKAGEWDVPVNEQECRCSFGRLKHGGGLSRSSHVQGQSGGAIAARLRTAKTAQSSRLKLGLGGYTPYRW